MTKDELDLVETDDILDVLERRFKAGVLLVGNASLSKSDSATHIYYRGGVVPALGLLAYAKIHISEDVRKSKEAP